MMDLFDQIEGLARTSRRADVPQVDVVDRVSRSIRLMREDEPALIDMPSLAFAGASLAVTGLAALMFSPVLMKLWDPWTAYMSAPWSL